jgi:hypothetical protein
MTRTDEFMGQLETYLDEYEGGTPLPEDVRDAIRAELPFTRQRQPRWPARRLFEMNRTAMIAIGAAAAVVLAAVFGMWALGGRNLGGPEPLVPPATSMDATSSSRSASPLDAPGREGPLDAGTYTAYAIGASAGHEADGSLVNVLFTVPDGWSWNGAYLSKGGIEEPNGAAIFFFDAEGVQVYTDPCHWAAAEPDRPTGKSVLDLVSALAAQPMRSAIEPNVRDAAVPDFRGDEPPVVIADRWAGMAVELTTPADLDFRECDRGEFRSWGPEQDARVHQGPAQRDLVWVVGTADIGVNGDSPRLIIDAASFPDTPPDVLLEIEAILDSIAVGHWG